MESFHEVFDFHNSIKNPPPTPIPQFQVSTLYIKQERNEHLGTLLSADPDFFTFIRATTLQATESTLKTLTQVARTLYLKIRGLSTLPRNLHQSPPAHLTTHDKTIFPPPPTPLFSNTSAGMSSKQMIPQTQLQSHQRQLGTFKHAIPPKTKTVKPSTVQIEINPTFILII